MTKQVAQIGKFETTEEAQSFFEVLNFFKVAIEHKVNLSERFSDDEIVSSMRKLGEIVHLNNSAKDFRSKSLFRLYSCVEEESLVSYINPEKCARNLETSRVNYFKFLNKHFEEDFYSDHICSMINYPFKSGFNLKVCQDILNFCYPQNKIEVTKVKANREVSLVNFGYKKAPLMRIDIVVDINDEYKMIIENKTKTLEHSNQTQYYYDALRCMLAPDKIFGVMLSPGKIKADCDDFESLDYLELFLIISERLGQSDDKELVMLTSFYEELKEKFYTPFNNSIKRSQQFRRKHG